MLGKQLKGGGMKDISRAFAALCLILGTVGSAWSFDLSPKGTRFDQEAVKAWSTWWDKTIWAVVAKGLPKFKESVHEEITHRIYGCNYDGASICGDPDAQFATPYVIAGVRWNDDPPFQLNEDQAKGMPCKTGYPDGRRMTIRFITQPKCWVELFLYGENKIKHDSSVTFDLANKSALPLRSHFGDLQFFHSMASVDGEDPMETRRKILGWAEFMWGIVGGDLRLETWLKDVDEPVVRQYFEGSGWRVQDLLSLGDTSLRPYIKDVAFGSLLHMVEDSFAAGHVERLEPALGAECKTLKAPAPGPILEFHSYTHQNSSNHANADTRYAFANNRLTPDVVDVGRYLVSLRGTNSKWDDVRAYLMCVYDLAPDVRAAGPGQF